MCFYCLYLWSLLPEIWRVEDKNSGSTFSVDKQNSNDNLFMSHNKFYVEVAKVDEIPSGRMKHVEVKVTKL